MRIALDGTVMQGGRLDGASRYAFHLAQALAITGPAPDELFVLYEPTAAGHGARVDELAAQSRVMLRPVAGLAKGGGEALVKALRAVEAEVYHDPYRAPRAPTKVPTVVTVHELAMLQSESRRPNWLGRLAQFTQRGDLRHLHRADAVICVSASLRQELLVAVEELRPERVHVVHNGVDHSRFHPRYRPEARQRAARLLGIEPPYLLALAQEGPRKNLRPLFQALAGLPNDAPCLVLAGAGSWGEGPIYEMVREARVENRVRFTGYVPEAILPDLYAGARAFIFPSVYEGFGLPVLEAMACGAPVVAGDRSSIPEVAGEAALLVDPTDPDALAGAILRLVQDKAFRDSLRATALGRAATFSWERTAVKTRDVYAAVAGR